VSEPAPFLLAAFLYLLLTRLLGAQASGATEMHVRPGVLGQAVTLVRNPSRDTVSVAVALWYAHVEGGAEPCVGVMDDCAGGQLVLEREVAALVSPNAFTLAPGESQVIRVKLREIVPPVTVLRLVVTYTPLPPRWQPGPNDSVAVARLVTVVRIITKLVVLEH